MSRFPRRSVPLTASPQRGARTAWLIAVLCLPEMPLATGACADSAARSAPSATREGVAAAADVQCTLERPTGSMLATKVCTTKAQRDATAVATREANDAIQRIHGPACPGTPGCASK